MEAINRNPFQLFITLGLSIFLFTSSMAFGLTPERSKSVDPVLINGTKYNFFPTNIDGHQYLISQDFSAGSATINGKIFNNLLMNYDIYNQSIVLQFTNQKGSKQMLTMSDAWITGFSLLDKNFVCRKMEDGSKKIFQEIGTEKIKILYSWRKLMRLNSSSGKYYFTKPGKDAFLLVNNTLKQFRGNRSFIKSFEEKHQNLIKKHMKKEGIRVSRLNDLQMLYLIEQCNIICKN